MSLTQPRILNRRAAGFTLLEVMLALAILAMAGLTMSQLVGAGANNTRLLQEKTLARWVADNELTGIALEGRWPGRLWQKYTVTLASRRWFVQVRSQETASDDFRQVQVEVRLSKDNSQAALARLQTYMVQNSPGAK